MGIAPAARGFSLLGPFPAWQVQALSYNWGSDIGGPENIGEGFRWNVPTITYAFDKPFLDYFGPEGVHAIEEAIQMLNDLPPASKISPDLSEYSTQTLRENYEASTLGLMDLKSAALNLMVEELGLADPIRFTFTLRSRAVIGTPPSTNYVVVSRNYDPVTLGPTAYVNDTLYSYEIQEFQQPFQHADSFEILKFTDGSALENVPVATGGFRSGTTGPNSPIAIGQFRVGLSRDDVGGLRYLYHKNNYAVEGLLTNITVGRRVDNTFGPFLAITNAAAVTNVVIGTNNIGTNIITVGLRGGKNKLRFQRVFFEGTVGSTFTPITNAYTDVVVSTNNELVVQPLLRPILQPDIVFSAGDLGTTVNNTAPIISSRTSTAGWIDNDALNGVDEVGQFAVGPGVINPQVIISFSTQLPAQIPVDSAFLGDVQEDSFTFTTGYWATFDGSTNAPIIYPRSALLNIQRLRNEILGGGQ
jgi:hypothetical protein